MKRVFARIMSGLMLLLIMGNLAQARELSPEEVAQGFYVWYLDVYKQDTSMKVLFSNPKMKETLSTALLERLSAQYSSPEVGCMDADYFLDSQDYLEDWYTKIEIKRLYIEDNMAGVYIILGQKPRTQNRLVVSLRKETGGWKIFHVFSVPYEEE